MQIHLASLDLGEIENVVDQGQQIFPGRLDVLHIPLLALGQVVSAGEHIAEAQDAVERGAQLMRHGGEEVGLQVIHLVQLQVGLRELIDLGIEFPVDLPEFLLDCHQVPQHAVERLAELFKFVPGADFGPPIQLAARDRVTHLPQVQHRFDNHVPHNRPRSGHGQKDRDDGGREQQGVVPRQAAIVL